ncbi:hypothetical protein CSW63_00205 (plasmid) [Caulobacter sp. FWC26]|nr:hypothetical protein CSW63_00205 [Caulobacter sp. FWC26]
MDDHRDDQQDEAEALLARIMMIRDDLKAGRLTWAQVEAYRRLGRTVERITRQMDAAPDLETADALWREGVKIIRTYLAEHFAAPTCH